MVVGYPETDFACVDLFKPSFGILKKETLDKELKMGETKAREREGEPNKLRTKNSVEREKSQCIMVLKILPF